MKTMHRFHYFLIVVMLLSTMHTLIYADASVSPSLFFNRARQNQSASKQAGSPAVMPVPVTIRFADAPSRSFLDDLEDHGLSFIRDNGVILHTEHIYPATLLPDSIESIASFPGIVSIEDSKKTFAQPPLDISGPLVQAPDAWKLVSGGLPLDGRGVIIANVDIGVDVFHPALFKADGGTYDWLDTNHNGMFDSGIDAVDLNKDGSADDHELLAFINAPFLDPNNIVPNSWKDSSFNSGIDWLYNDSNSNGIRDYGSEKGYTESSPSFGEMFFIFSDGNNNHSLDPDERLTGLGTSKIIAVYCGPDAIYERSKNLMNTPQETMNHGTSAAGITLGQWPGQTFAGIAPGAELIVINRSFLDDRSTIEQGILWAVNHGAKIVMHEFGSWVGEFLDGTSNYEIMIDELTAKGIHQLTAAGNLAGSNRKKHAAITIESNTQKDITFTVPSASSINQVQISILWRTKNDFLRPQITFISPQGSFTLDYTTNTHLLTNYLVMYGITSSPRSSTDSMTVRIDILFENRNPDGIISGDFSLNFRNGFPFPYDIDTYIADNVTSWIGGAQFTGEFVTDDGTVTSPGTARTDITVGAFYPREYPSMPGSNGTICRFSGWGNTIDGRRAVDITAPGANVFTPVSHYYFGTTPGGYIDFTGTSAALPFVTGCAALIVQAAPDITPAELSSVLSNSAYTDEFTGSVPNDRWGYGKLHIYDSLYDSELAFPVMVADDTPTSLSLSQPYPNPFNQTTRIDIIPFNTSNRNINAIVYSLTGQKVRTLKPLRNSSTNSFLWDGTDNSGHRMASGIYLISVTDGISSKTVSAVLLK
jgi:hypothetical protein